VLRLIIAASSGDATRLQRAGGALQVDSGVGCAAAMISAALRGLPETTCRDDGPRCCG